jgi:ferredoxin--NADP+ reductase
VSFLECAVVGRTDWAEGLFSLTLDGQIDAFQPGQFVNLAIEQGGELVKRSYSIASAPGQPLEFYLVRVGGGALTPVLFDKRIGDTVLVEREPYGFFSLDHVPPARHLWMVATGTGLAPFLSMLRSGTPLERFERVVLVHGVRLGEQLAYRGELEALAAASRGRLSYLPLVSRQTWPGALEGRVTDVLSDGRLEGAADLALTTSHSHVMLCGNPEMIRDMQSVLGERGLRKHRMRAPGHITVERYW